MQFMFNIFFILVLEEFLLTKIISTQTDSIVDLYKKISEKGSLVDGLSLNNQAQIKLKTINTIRLLSLTSISMNNSRLLFNISLDKIQINEEVKLIEFRLKLKSKINKKKLFLIIKNDISKKKKRFRPMIISKDESEYLSYDLTDYLIHNSSKQILIIRRQLWIRKYLEEASLVIYSRTPGGFILPSSSSNIRTKRTIKQITTGPCSRHDLFVDFDQLSFGAWVVEPKKFNAGICRGDCPNPLSRLYYPTNHAMLLSLLHERGNSIQQPSCVPVRLRSLDLLYYDHRELIIKRHQGMQVVECGCR
ncbi:unnamed protein product [Adineta steineri]|uniref:TGF-beta family profile domain-containing protein n=1 Tax=Adineta steineri TaxID=433720 RepID=A0A815BP35_9BILA|nr:unnamed protein product [Adineta steineri]CAF1246695.1 unnamed protein product [Adineta steineri]CAF1275503.1 unnamed protein product [Adineta steineri]